MGQGEDNMDVARGEKFLTTRFEPTVAGVGLTLGAVPVTAANGEIPISCLMESNLYWGVRSAWCQLLSD